MDKNKQNVTTEETKEEVVIEATEEVTEMPEEIVEVEVKKKIDKKKLIKIGGIVVGVAAGVAGAAWLLAKGRKKDVDSVFPICDPNDFADHVTAQLEDYSGTTPDVRTECVPEELTTE